MAKKAGSIAPLHRLTETKSMPNYHFSITVFILLLLVILLQPLLIISISGNRGSTVVKVLCYISEGRWFDPS